MMNNNVTGIVISGLLHVGMLGWISTVNNKTMEIYTPSSKVVLTVSMFKAEVIPSPAPTIIKTTVRPKPLVKITAPTPLTPEFADLSVTSKIVTKPVSPPQVTEKKLENVASLKLAKIKPSPKLVKPKTVKKALQTKKPRKKLVKKKALLKKVKKPVKSRVVKKTVVRKIVKKQTKKVFVKIKPRQQRRISPPVKKSVSIAKQRKKAAAYLARKNSQRVKQQQARRRAKQAAAYKKSQTKQYAKKVAPQRQQTLSKPKPSTTNTALNASLGKQYKTRLQQLIAANKRYPKRAKRRGHQGRVTLSFRVTHSGVISNIRVIKGAKNNDLNLASIKAIQLASGKLRYPKGMNKKSLTLTVTLSYILS